MLRHICRWRLMLAQVDTKKPESGDSGFSYHDRLTGVKLVMTRRALRPLRPVLPER